jgi:RNA polymerase sigma factor (sigma-70 family)
MMGTGVLGGVLRHLRRAALLPEREGLGDGDLLQMFVATHDEAAFEALARRHGPMVLGVCRRILRNEADAEDAFQATFLILVKKAATILPRSMVGNWLYGVAHNTALKAKAMNSKRRMKETEAVVWPLDHTSRCNAALGCLVERMDCAAPQQRVFQLRADGSISISRTPGAVPVVKWTQAGLQPPGGRPWNRRRRVTGCGSRVAEKNRGRFSD